MVDGPAPARFRQMLSELDRTSGCANPIHLVVDRGGRGPDEVLLVSCKDRRATVCPACSHTYKGDAWQVVATGLAGGKGVDREVACHPRVFATLTAPSFGAVHRRPSSNRGSALCHPRPLPDCRHGRTRTCAEIHSTHDPLVGQPLCPDCFDYTGAVLWNAGVTELWRGTTRRLVRAVAERAGQDVRVSYVKAAEFQRRGLVHVHVVLRLDRRDGVDPPEVGAGVLLAALAAEVPRSGTTQPAPGRPRRLRWGRQMTTAEVAAAGGTDSELADDRSLAVAAYLAKYATKTADEAGVLSRPLRSTETLGSLPLDQHHRHLVECALSLDGLPQLAHLGLRRHAHTFGYRGHVLTKSRHYSTTFGALRQARVAYRRASGRDLRTEEIPVRLGYGGRGYEDPATSALAFELGRLANHPPTSTDG